MAHLHLGDGKLRLPSPELLILGIQLTLQQEDVCVKAIAVINQVLVAIE
jgi:hypothetical protein